MHSSIFSGSTLSGVTLGGLGALGLEFPDPIKEAYDLGTKVGELVGGTPDPAGASTTGGSRQCTENESLDQYGNCVSRFRECTKGEHLDAQGRCTPDAVVATTGGGGGIAPPKPAGAQPVPPPATGMNLADMFSNPLVWAGLLVVGGGIAIFVAKKRKAARLGA